MVSFVLIAFLMTLVTFLSVIFAACFAAAFVITAPSKSAHAKVKKVGRNAAKGGTERVHEAVEAIVEDNPLLQPKSSRTRRGRYH
eukprot:g5872.t1